MKTLFMMNSLTEQLKRMVFLMFATLVRYELIRTGQKQNIICDRIGIQKSQFSQQLKRDNFRESDMRKIADALGYDIRITFVPRDSKPTPTFSGYDFLIDTSASDKDNQVKE
jgi:translation initiation factor 2 beta subunit (eIF-2beta)/eIF-5